MLALCRFLLVLVLPLSLLLLAFPSSSLSVTVTPANGAFRGWDPSAILSDPSDNSTMWLIDWPRYIRAVNPMNGSAIQPNRSLDNRRILSAGIDTRNQHIVAVTGGESFLSQLDLTLHVLQKSDLSTVATLSLNAALDPPLPSRPSSDWFFNTLPIDSKGNIYFPRQLSNRTLLVYVISPEGKQLKTWTQPWKDDGTRYVMTMGPADLLYIQSFYYYYRRDGPRSLYVVNTDGELQTTLYLNTSMAEWEQIGGISVSYKTGNIVLGSDNNVLLFNSAGMQLPSFRYNSLLLEWYDWILSITFDAADRVLVIPAYGEYGVQVLGRNGDLLSCWTNGVPNLYRAQNLVYDQRSSSVVVFLPEDDLVALRLDHDTGRLIQEYYMIGRLTEDYCYHIASDLGQSGDLYLLLRCGWDYWGGTVVLQSLNYAGQTRRQLVVPGVQGLELQPALLVSEDKQMFYLLSYDDTGAGANKLLAFAFNGSRAYEAVDKRIGSIGSDHSTLTRVDDTTLAVVDPANDRIVLLDLDTGAYFGQLKMPANTYLLAAVHDGEYWYRSEFTWGDIPWEWNSTVGQYAANGDLLAQFVIRSQSEQSSIEWISVARSGQRQQRLYALDREQEALVWWDLQAQQAEAAESDGVVRVVQASGVSALHTDANTESRTGRRSLRQKEDERLQAADKLRYAELSTSAAPAAHKRRMAEPTRRSARRVLQMREEL